MPRSCTSIPAELGSQLSRFREGLHAGWLAMLPHLVADCCDRWKLTLDTPYTYPSLSYVAPASRYDGTFVVLKIGPLLDELALEIDALRLYEGHGMARLVDADRARGCLLIERLTPGDNLTSVADDDEAVAIAASVMRQLRAAPPSDHGFPSVNAWFDGLQKMRERFDGSTGPLPALLVERAEGVSRELLASMDSPVVLHGDLQHFNMLRADRQPWLAIDPKGVIGESAYEVGAFLRNQLTGSDDDRRLLARRVDQFAEELSIDRERIRGWGMAQAVLSAWWSVEDIGAGWENAIHCAEVLDAL